MIGTICAIHSSEQYQMDVSFHDSNSRPFHFTCLEEYSLAALGSSGAIFACPSTSTNFSKAYYRPVDNWSNKNDWSLELPLNENILAVGVSKFAVILATDANYARVISLSGIQTTIKSLPGPIVTIAGNDVYIMLVFHLSGTFGANQNMGYALHNTQTGEVVEGACPITPNSTLTWAGFSAMGVSENLLTFSFRLLMIQKEFCEDYF
jgi:chromosome transmission fidelity protein 4